MSKGYGLRQKSALTWMRFREMARSEALRTAISVLLEHFLVSNFGYFDKTEFFNTHAWFQQLLPVCPFELSR
jgi:hypothetical protein